MAELSIFPRLAAYASVQFGGQLVPAGTVRAAAIHLAPQALRLGLSASAFRRQLQATFGQSYRWQNLIDDYRRIDNRLKHESQIRNLAPDREIPRAYYSEERLRGNYKYRVHFHAEYQHRETGEIVNAPASMYSNAELGRSGWERQYADEYNARHPRYEWELIIAEIRAVEHNTGWDY